MKKVGKKIRAYIDTNIFVYAITHHPSLGNICAEILRDAYNNVFNAIGSFMVAIELLGSLSKIDANVASRALVDYLSLPFIILPIRIDVLKAAAIINSVVNLRYDSIHLALMILNKIPIIISNDMDWKKAENNITEILEELNKEGFIIDSYSLKLITPKDYKNWKTSYNQSSN